MRTFEVHGEHRRSFCLAVQAKDAVEAEKLFTARMGFQPTEVGLRAIIGYDEGTGNAIFEGDPHYHDGDGVLFSATHKPNAQDQMLETEDVTPDEVIRTFLFARSVEAEMKRARGLFPGNVGIGLALLEELGEFAVELNYLTPSQRTGPIDDEKSVTEGVQVASTIGRLLTEGFVPFGEDDEALERELLCAIVRMGERANQLLEEKKS